MMRYLDLVILALALPIFIVAGLPLLGWVGAAGAWLLQRGVQHLIEKRARATDDPAAVGLTEREAGLTAAILSITLFTFYFAGQMIARPFGPESESPK